MEHHACLETADSELGLADADELPNAAVDVVALRSRLPLSRIEMLRDTGGLLAALAVTDVSVGSLFEASDESVCCERLGGVETKIGTLVAVAALILAATAGAGADDCSVLRLSLPGRNEMLRPIVFLPLSTAAGAAAICIAERLDDALTSFAVSLLLLCRSLVGHATPMLFSR